MGALTIKNYSFETRIWELQRLVFPNIFSGLPSHLLLLTKNNIIQRIFSFNRNDIISNNTRFSCSTMQSIIKNLKQTFGLNFYLFSNKFIIILFSFILLFIKIISFYRSYYLVSWPCLYVQYNERLLAVIENSFNYYNFIVTLNQYKVLLYSNMEFNYDYLYVSVDNLLLCLSDDENFIVFQKNFKEKNPDFFYFIFKTFKMYSDLEVEEEEDVLIDKPNRSLICTFSKSNFKYIWFVLQNKIKMNIFILFEFFDLNNLKHKINTITPFNINRKKLVIYLSFIIDTKSCYTVLSPFGLIVNTFKNKD